MSVMVPDGLVNLYQLFVCKLVYLVIIEGYATLSSK